MKNTVRGREMGDGRVMGERADDYTHINVRGIYTRKKGKNRGAGGKGEEGREVIDISINRDCR